VKPLAPTFDTAAQRWTIDVPSATSSADLADALPAAVSAVSDAGGGVTHLWIHEINDDLDVVATDHDFTPHRDLWQLRCDLPAERSTIETRAFTIEDAASMVAVNNRAFSWHPEQSGLTVEALTKTMQEPWFNADGFRLYQPDDELLGFCWTKVHADLDPVLGEIYVIAVDPSAHGQGLGSPMTLAGLDWLAAQGIAHGMLYVESDNAAANRTYERIGFVHHHTDRAYNRTIETSAR